MSLLVARDVDVCRLTQNLLEDSSHIVRSLVAFGVCKICAMYWSYIPADVIKTLLTSLVQKHAWDSSNTQVRLSVVNVSLFFFVIVISVYGFVIISDGCRHLSTEDQVIECVEEFCCLGSVVTDTANHVFVEKTRPSGSQTAFGDSRVWDCQASFH